MSAFLILAVPLCPFLAQLFVPQEVPDLFQYICILF